MTKETPLPDHLRAHTGNPADPVGHGQHSPKASRSNVAYINSHRAALDRPKFGYDMSPGEAKKHLARINEHAPYGNDPWGKE